MNQSEFLEKVHGLIALAESHGGVITHEMMEAPFAESKLDGEQLLALRSYLKANGVQIQSEEEQQAIKMEAVKNTRKLESKEKQIYKAYLEELELVKGYKPEEEELLISRKMAGDKQARQLLVEGNLRQVVEIAGIYAGHGVPLSDLVQEGNMELLMFIDEFQGGNLSLELKKRVSKAMELLIEESEGNDSFKKRMADMANKLMDASEAFADDNGVQPTLEDLARKLHIREDEVEAVMKMSMNAMTIEETGFGGE